MTIFHHKLLEIFLLNLARSSLVLFVLFAAVVVPEAVTDLGDVSLNWNESLILIVLLISDHPTLAPSQSLTKKGAAITAAPTRQSTTIQPKVPQPKAPHNPQP